VQIIINADSLHSASVIRANTARVGKTHPVTGEQYTAGIFRIMFHFKNSTDLSGVYYVFDTVNVYTQTNFQNTYQGSGKYREYIRTDSLETYYDFRFMKYKKRYFYKIDGKPPEPLECWHSEKSNVFFLNHRN
jgi:hypothetical protein